MAHPGDPYRAAPWVVLVAVTWCWARAGGSGGPDLLVLVFLLGSALAFGGSPGRAVPAAARISVVLLAIAWSWLVLDGLLRAGSVRLVLLVPAVWLASCLVVLLVRQADRESNERALVGLVLLGTVHAALALPEWVRLLRAGVVDPTGLPRAGSPLLNSPNALGALLVATALLTARLLVRGPARWPAPALAVQLLGILATGSRYAVLAALTALGVGGWRLLTRSVGRPRSRLLLVAGAGWAGLALLVLGIRARWFVHEPRVGLWRAAWHRVEQHPWVGSGPVPERYPVPGFRVTTHAHDEPLQLAVDFGLPVVALLLLALLLALRAARPWRDQRFDPWLAGGAAVVAGSGSVDYSLRLPAVTLVLAWLATSARTRGWPSARIRE